MSPYDYHLSFGSLFLATIDGQKIFGDCSDNRCDPRPESSLEERKFPSPEGRLRVYEKKSSEKKISIFL